VALGPGSFTGLRVGIATIQGLALAHHRKVVGISVIDTLAHIGSRMSANTRVPELLVPWVDGKRSEVFAAIYERKGSPESSERDWRVKIEPIANHLNNRVSWFIGDGVRLYRSLLETHTPPESRIILDIPRLAGEIAIMASNQQWFRKAAEPHALRPVYVRRPDAELARNRRLRLESTTIE
jgi:tRNA threonylcarbamoyladenosine biosynthesis protein TsaB